MRIYLWIRDKIYIFITKIFTKCVHDVYLIINIAKVYIYIFIYIYTICSLTVSLIMVQYKTYIISYFISFLFHTKDWYYLCNAFTSSHVSVPIFYFLNSFFKRRITCEIITRLFILSLRLNTFFSSMRFHMLGMLQHCICFS